MNDKRLTLIITAINIVLVIIMSAYFVTTMNLYNGRALPEAPVAPRAMDDILLNAWQPATVVTTHAYLWHFDDVDDGIPTYLLPKGSRVYVQYERDGKYFIKYQPQCLENPIFGWLSSAHIQLDKDK